MRYLPILLLLGLLNLGSAKIDHDEVHVGEKEVHQQSTTADSKQHNNVDHAKIYTQLFKAKRREHALAVSSAKNIDYDKRRGFLEEIIVNIRKILLETREIIERIGHAASAPFPHDSDTLKDAISKVLENIALFSDLSLHFPRNFEKKMDKDRKLKTVIVWAYEYAKDTGLMDEDTQKIVNLMAQQHQIIPKEEGYLNPYDTTEKKEEVARKAYEDDQRRRKEKKNELKAAKKNKSKGSKLTKSHSEL